MGTAAINLAAASAAAVLVACGAAPSDAPQGSGKSVEPVAGWEAPENYEFVVESQCGERAFIGRFRIVVEDGQVAETEALDEDAQASLGYLSSEQVPTLSQLLDEAMEARRAGADEVEVRTDSSDGHPTSIEIDGDLDASDDEACYIVSDYIATRQ